MTQRIADYFNSKSWYKGTVEPETFDADTSVFNEYEVANIQKIADDEESFEVKESNGYMKNTLRNVTSEW